MSRGSEYKHAQQSRYQLGGRDSPISRGAGYAWHVLTFLVGPTLLAWVLLGYDGAWDSGRKSLLAVGAGVTAIFVISVIWTWLAALRKERQLRRLDAVGVPAVAEIVASHPIPLGGEAGVALTFRITGRGLTVFETVIECIDEPDLHVGKQFKARVDPGVKLFSIVRSPEKG